MHSFQFLFPDRFGSISRAAAPGMLDSGPRRADVLESMTREQMVAEFGAPGVQNARIVDLITPDAERDRVILAMFENRPWGASARQLVEIEEKINRYLGYVLDGFLVEHYPRYLGKRVQIRLDCVAPPSGVALPFVQAARRAIEAQGLEFVVNVTTPRP